MRSFSKKLAFVLAAAMVVTAFAPAAKAEAAKEMAINKSSQILYVNEGINHKGGEVAAPGKGNVSVYDFSVKNKPADWKDTLSFKWTSSNEDVVTVANGGVATAVGVGKATVYCKVTDKATKEVTTLKTKVTVKANAYDVEITNADKWDGATVEVNGVVDLNRAMYDEDGNKTTKRGTLVTDYTKWVAEPAAGVEIDQKTGKFTFTEAAVAGEYKLSCYTYQSSKYTEKTAESDVVVVEFVKANTYEVKQTTRDDVVLSFAQAVDLTVADVTIKENVGVIGGTDKVDYLVKSVTPSEDKKTYTVAVFYEFNDGATYDVAVKGIEDAVSFVASKGAPKTIVLHSNEWNTSDRSVVVGQDTKIFATLYDAKGVNVTNTELLNRLTFTVKYADSEYERVDSSLYFTEVGERAVVTAEYRTYEYDENGNEKDVAVSEPYTFYAVAKGEELITGIEGYTTNGNFWAGDRTVVKMNENWRWLTVGYKTKDFPYDTLTLDAFEQEVWNKDRTVCFGTANFTSLDPDLLEVFVTTRTYEDAEGNDVTVPAVGLYPRKVGAARVMVSYVTSVNGVDVTTPIGAVTIDVKESPVLNTIALKETMVVISTSPANVNAGIHSQNVENKYIGLDVKDQYNNGYGSYEIVADSTGNYAGYGLKGNNELSKSAIENGAIVWVGNGLVLDNDKFEVLMNNTDGKGTKVDRTKFSFTLTVKDSTPGVNVVKTAALTVDARRPVDTDLKDTNDLTINWKDVEFFVDFGMLEWNGRNTARFLEPSDYDYRSEGCKNFGFAVYQLNNGARYDEIPMMGALPAKEDIANASAGYYYVINKNGVNVSNVPGNFYDDANGNGEIRHYNFSTYDASDIDASKTVVKYDPVAHGAGVYEIILYRVERFDVKENGVVVGTVGKESRVTSRKISVTCDPGQYTFVSRDEAIISELTPANLLSCFTIADRWGNKVSHASWELNDTTAKFGNDWRLYKINTKTTESINGTDSVFVESITVWEQVNVPDWGEKNPIYVEYTVPVGYMVKIAQ